MNLDMNFQCPAQLTVSKVLVTLTKVVYRAMFCS